MAFLTVGNFFSITKSVHPHVQVQTNSNVEPLLTPNKVGFCFWETNFKYLKNSGLLNSFNNMITS